MEPTIIHRTKVYDKLRSTHGKLFSVVFIKKDGTERHMVAQIRPPKPNPKRPAPAKESNPYILVGDMGKYMEAKASGKDKQSSIDASYRLINIETIKSFKMGGIAYIVEG